MYTIFKSVVLVSEPVIIDAVWYACVYYMLSGVLISEPVIIDVATLIHSCLQSTWKMISSYITVDFKK